MTSSEGACLPVSQPPPCRAQTLKELDLKILQAQTDPERILLLSRKLKLLQVRGSAGHRCSISSGPIKVNERGQNVCKSLPQWKPHPQIVISPIQNSPRVVTPFWNEAEE